MATIVEKRRVHCEKRHVSAWVVKRDDGGSTVKCGLLKACGDSCPFLKDPDHKRQFRRAPAYVPK